MVFFKLFHVFFLIVWLSSLLFITRMAHSIDKFSLRKLYFFTDLPAMCLAITLGLTSFLIKEMDFKGGWLHMKLTMVALLIFVDILTGRALSAQKMPSKKYFIFLHGVILILLFLILFSVYVLKPAFPIEKNGL